MMVEMVEETMGDMVEETRRDDGGKEQILNAGTYPFSILINAL